MSYLSVNNLSVSFNAPKTKNQKSKTNNTTDTIQVVSGLSFSLEQGEIGCLLGYSGCGKTTALRAIAGLESAQSGQVTLDGITLTSDTLSVSPDKRGVGLVFQDYALFGHLSVFDNIAFGLHKWASSKKQQRVREMLELIDLVEHAHKKPAQLSGGQQQRIALARALAPEPKLLLLDEPFSNLDVVLRESLAMSVRDILKRTNTTAILVTHDQNEAFAIADKIGVMNHGRLEQWASASALYHKPASPFVADFIGEGTLITGVVRGSTILTEIGNIEMTQDVSKEGIDDWSALAEGSEVQVLIRPDDIVHDDASSKTAKVISRVFRGANFLYHLELDNGEIVYSLVPSHHDHEMGLRIGYVTDLEHVVVFNK